MGESPTQKPINGLTITQNTEHGKLITLKIIYITTKFNLTTNENYGKVCMKNENL